MNLATFVKCGWAWTLTTSSTAAREVMTYRRIFSGFYAVSAMIRSMLEMPRYDKSLPNWQAKSGAYDHCPDCGGWKSKRAAKCRGCTDYLELGKRRWKDNPSSSAAHSRAISHYGVLGVCMDCGKLRTVERHHKDGDPANNEASNIAFLCRRCHMVVDGRLERFRQLRPPVRPAKICSECGKFSAGKYLRRGLCHACNERKRRREKRCVSP
jgi:hypothetical protein